MKTELHYYDIFPKVFPAGKEVEITIKPLGYHADFENPERSAYEGIIATENFFKSIGMPTRLSELKIDDKNLKELAKRCTFYGKRTLPGIVELDEDKIFDIYCLMK